VCAAVDTRESGRRVTRYSVTRLVTRFVGRWYSLLLVAVTYSLLRY